MSVLAGQNRQLLGWPAGIAARSSNAPPIRIPQHTLASVPCGCKTRQSNRSFVLHAGPNDKKLLREDEPSEFWQAGREKEGENPAKDPLAIIGILGILLPFLIVGALVALGVIDPNPTGKAR